MTDAERVLFELVGEYRPGQSLGPLRAASGRAIVGPKASLAHRWCAALLSSRAICGERRVTPRRETERPADLASLRDEAAGILLESGVEEECVAALFDPFRLKRMLLEHGEFRSLVYWNRRRGEDGEPVRYAFGELNAESIVVDGSNVAWNRGVRERGGQPRIEHVLALCAVLSAEYGIGDIRVFFDANIGEEAPDAGLLDDLARLANVVTVPGGTEADETVLSEAASLDCLLVSNDRFRDHRKRARKSLTRVLSRRVGVYLAGGAVELDPLIEELPEHRRAKSG